jgi:hypothetical protein
MLLTVGYIGYQMFFGKPVHISLIEGLTVATMAVLMNGMSIVNDNLWLAFDLWVENIPLIGRKLEAAVRRLRLYGEWLSLAMLLYWIWVKGWVTTLFPHSSIVVVFVFVFVVVVVSLTMLRIVLGEVSLRHRILLERQYLRLRQNRPHEQDRE